MKSNTKILDLKAASAADVEHVIGRDSLAVLAGSGVSIWEPSSLPSGQQFTLGVYEALFFTHGSALVPDPVDDKWLRAWFDVGDLSLDLPAVPFEVLMERCPRADSMHELICRLYSSGAANPVHEAIAQLAVAGKVHSVVTTNYDTGLDNAFHAAGAPLNRTVREKDIRPDNSRRYFKIHGSASIGDKDTIVHRLRFEGTLPPWKRSLLAEIVHDRVLLVVGYSGIDFDVCPELSVASPRSVVWNFLKQEAAENSPGLRRLENAGIAVTVIVGDMKTLLCRLGTVIYATLARPAFDVASELRSVLTASELLLWRSRVLSSMGFARLANKAADALDQKSLDPVEIFQARAQGQFHAGRYKRSANIFRQASAASSDERLRRLCLLDACDAERCAGRLRAANKLVAYATSTMPTDAAWASEVEGVADLKRILLAREIAALSGRLFLPGGRQALISKIRPILARAASRAIEHGRWFDFQQAALWASRVGVPLYDLQPPGGYEPPPPRIGYRHLGYPVAIAMESCDRARKGFCEITELKGLLELMTRFGCAPQAWKLAYALVRFDIRYLKSHGRSLFSNFARCEYTVPMRLAWLIRGS